MLAGFHTPLQSKCTAAACAVPCDGAVRHGLGEETIIWYWMASLGNFLRH